MDDCMNVALNDLQYIYLYQRLYQNREVCGKVLSEKYAYKSV